MASERDSGWREYYERTAGQPPRHTLVAALARFGADTMGRSAVDLGCGDGRDTIELLRRGWRVLAIDAEPTAIARLEARPDLPPDALLATCCARFEDATWPAVDLVNASFALPLCPPERFPELWARIERSLGPGGRFAGQLFGERDEWRGEPGITHHGRADVERLLATFTVEMLAEEESDSITPYGKPKHWHLFHIVACKR
ncbi:MAG TPA: class I SAM-dependent methyltransferase [Stellaceae bacterium]|nr:class I SAM-dependent methyltransferase [Stellaceae bacterium]